MQVQFNLINAQIFNGVFQENLTAFYAKASVFNGSGNVANGNGPYN